MHDLFATLNDNPTAALYASSDVIEPEVSHIAIIFPKSPMRSFPSSHCEFNRAFSVGLLEPRALFTKSFSPTLFPLIVSPFSTLF